MPAGFTSILWFTATITGAALNTSYGADACDHRVGNRESHTTREGVTTAYTLATAANEYATVGGAAVVYDAGGNLIQDEAGWQYVYDERSLLTQVKDDSGGVVANYTYDALGRRIIFQDVVAGTTRKYYYDGASLIQERNGSDVLTQYHVNGGQYIDERVATMDSGGEWIVHLMGNNFSVMGDGDDTGAITRTAYGTLGDFVDPPDPSDSGTFTLHGRPIDVLSNGTRTLVLMHVRARVYDPKNARWLQRDPSGYVDGNNLYESFGSNPTRFVDPFGDDDLDPTRYGFFGASPEEVRRGMQASQAGWWAVQQGATFDQAQSIAAEALNPPLPLFQEEFRREFAIGFGVIGTAGGVLEIAGGVTLFVPSLGFTTVFIAHGADVTQASARQVWTGEFTPTFTYTWIAEAGYPTTAMIVDMGLSISSGFSGPATSWLRVAGRTGMGVFRGETTAAARAPFFVRMDRAIRRLPMRLLPRMESGSVSLGTNFSLGPVSGAGRIKPLTGAQLPLSFPDPPGGALSLRIAPTTTRAGAAASPMTGSQWYEALSARYGAENVTWSRLPAYTGGKTSGVLATSIGDIDLISGYVGPSAAMGNGAIPGMNNVLRAHVEGHAASAMSQLGINDATRPTG